MKKLFTVLLIFCSLFNLFAVEHIVSAIKTGAYGSSYQSISFYNTSDSSLISSIQVTDENGVTDRLNYTIAIQETKTKVDAVKWTFSSNTFNQDYKVTLEFEPLKYSYTKSNGTTVSYTIPYEVFFTASDYRIGYSALPYVLFPNASNPLTITGDSSRILPTSSTTVSEDNVTANMTFRLNMDGTTSVVVAETWTIDGTMSFYLDPAADQHAGNYVANVYCTIEAV